MTKIQKPNTQTTEQTPIEILLDVDENGMTTAKKLYTFLELDTKNYSRWCNANILKNKFAELDKDYFPFVVQEEQIVYSSSMKSKRGNFATDYKLTSEFAKQLSMLSKSERGEQARQYFLACEKGLEIAIKHISNTQAVSTDVLKSMEAMNQQVIQMIAQNQQAQTAQLTALTTLITSTLPKPYKPLYTRWMGNIYAKIDIIAGSLNLSRKQTLHKLYMELQDTYDIDLNEYRHEYCYTHNLDDTGLCTMNAIEADQHLKQMFQVMVDNYIEQQPADTQNIFTQTNAS